jgi:hypothetical protein
MHALRFAHASPDAAQNTWEARLGNEGREGEEEEQEEVYYDANNGDISFHISEIRKAQMSALRSRRLPPDSFFVTRSISM